MPYPNEKHPDDLTPEEIKELRELQRDLKRECK